MPRYYPGPFPFRDIVQKNKVEKLTLEESIRAHIRSLVLMRVGEFAYDRSIGFEMWEYDKQVFYHEREPYYSNKKTEKGKLEGQNAQNHFRNSLKKLIEENEIRLFDISTKFKFEKVQGNLSVYQRKIMIEVRGKLRSTGKALMPYFRMSILYTPFQVESN